MPARGVIDRAIARFLAGETPEVEEIRAAIEAVVRGFRFAPDVEQDLVQEALARLVASLRERRFRGDSSLRTYAQNVAKYACLEFRRRRRSEVDLDPDELPSPALWSAPEEILLSTEEHRWNLEAFASLPADSRQVLLLIFTEGLSYREVAARLGITDRAIKSRVHRMRLFFRRRLAPRFGHSLRQRPAAERVGE